MHKLRKKIAKNKQWIIFYKNDRNETRLKIDVQYDKTRLQEVLSTSI